MCIIRWRIQSGGVVIIDVLPLPLFEFPTIEKYVMIQRKIIRKEKERDHYNLDTRVLLLCLQKS